MSTDCSEGWDEAAARFQAARTSIGQSLVQSWAHRALPTQGSILDVGCGSGYPIAQALFDDGFQIFGIDASPILIAEFRRNVPEAKSLCEPAQNSKSFDRHFDGAIAIGFIFLLEQQVQGEVLRRIADVLLPGGRFLFTAPFEACDWEDTITGRLSRSLGKREYEKLLNLCGLDLLGCERDEGGNNYFDAAKRS